MTGAEQLIVTYQYLALITVSMLFSIFAILRRTAILDMIATICWWIAGASHLVSSPSISPLFSISYLWFALGTVFFVLIWKDIFKMWNFHKNKDDWMEDTEI